MAAMDPDEPMPKADVEESSGDPEDCNALDSPVPGAAYMPAIPAEENWLAAAIWPMPA